MGEWVLLVWVWRGTFHCLRRGKADIRSRSSSQAQKDSLGPKFAQFVLIRGE
jgi:hypothetical protein